MTNVINRRRLLACILTLTIAVGLLLNTASYVFAEGDGLTKPDAISQLEPVVSKAKNIDLSKYDAVYSDQVEYALDKAESLIKSPTSTAYDLYIARLRLQVALDALIVDVQKATVPELQNLIKNGTLTYVELTKIYLTRIELYDYNTVKLNSILVMNENALALAAACDEAFKADPTVAQGIFGMTIMIKDNIGTIGTDGMATTAGSVVLKDNYAPYDSTQVADIKAAGGIILGKLNLSEYANYIASGSPSAAAKDFFLERYGYEYPYSGSMPSGFSSLGGQVFNPYKIDLGTAGNPVLSPSGSSSGSGAASAAGLSAMTIGSETSGSILSPSTANSIVGVKPTVGLISRYGVIPLSSSQDTTGPMTRNVTDAATLLTAMTGPDPEHDTHVDTYSKEPDFDVDYTQFLSKDALNGKRIGVIGSNNDNTGAYANAIATLQSLGATIVRPGGNNISFNYPSNGNIFQYDFKKDMAEYLSDKKIKEKTLLDIIDSFEANPDTANKFGYHILINAHLQNTDPDSADTKAYLAAREATNMGARKNIDETMDLYNLDAFISLGGNSNPAATSGYPAVTVPAGYQDRAHDASNWGAINICFTGDAFSEGKLLGMAYAFEQATQARVAPGMAVKTELRNLIATVETMEDYVAANAASQLEAAKATVASNFTTQMEIDNAYVALNDAVKVARPADKRFLELTIQYAESQDTTYLNEAALEKFDAALANAREVNANSAALQSDVDDAYYNLHNTIHLLSFTADPTMLQNIVNYSTAIKDNLDNYLPAGQNEFLAAYANAQNVLADPAALDADFTDAAIALNEKLLQLRFIPDRTLLASLLTTGYALNTSLYTADSANGLILALSFAQGIYDNIDSTKEDVDTASSGLQSAMSALVAMPQTTPSPKPIEYIMPPAPTTNVVYTGSPTRAPAPIYTIVPVAPTAPSEPNNQYALESVVTTAATTPAIDAELPAPADAIETELPVSAEVAATPEVNATINDDLSPTTSGASDGTSLISKDTINLAYLPFIIIIIALLAAITIIMIRQTRKKKKAN